MECRRCGAQITEDARFCSACGQATRENAGAAGITQGETAVTETEAPATESEAAVAPRAPAKARIAYAGFWLRAFAYAIDTLVVGITAGIFILGPLMERAGISTQDPWAFWTNESRQAWAIKLLMIMAQWLYWAVLESSAWQATLGKRMLGLYVTDLEGKRLTFARASGRYFAKIISTLTLGIGYLMAGFTPKKQALHDLIAECLVLKKTSKKP